MKLWKRLLGLFFLLLVFDGALRKWVLPSQETALLLLKDVVLWGAFFLYAQRYSALAFPRPLRSTWVPVLLGAYIFVVVLQAFNLRQPNLAVGAIGIKAHLSYLPLAVMLPTVLVQASRQQIVRFLWGYVLLVHIPLMALSLYQFSQPPTAWVNQYVREMMTVATLGEGRPRITGTFSYIGSYTPFLEAVAFGGLGVLLAGLRWRDHNLSLLGGTLLGSTAMVLPMTGSRGPVLVVVVGAVALLVIMRDDIGRKIQLLLACVAIGLATFVIFDATDTLEGWEALADRVERTQDEEDRIRDALVAPVTGLGVGGLLGYGVGTNHQAAPRFVASSQRNWQGWLGVDNGVLRVTVELGLLGMLGLLALKLALVHLSVQVVRDSATSIEFLIGATVFCILLRNVLFPVVFNPVVGITYWSCAGLAIGMWSLQKAKEGYVQAHYKSMRSIRLRKNLIRD